jgi:hypothetical protein
MSTRREVSIPSSRVEEGRKRTWRKRVRNEEASASDVRESVGASKLLWTPLCLPALSLRSTARIEDC